MGVPGWFFGANAVLEILALLACILLLYLSNKIYKATGEKRHYFFGMAFGAVGLSFLARAAVHILFYIFGPIAWINKIGNFINYGSLLYIVLTLMAYLILLAIAMKVDRKRFLALIFIISLVAIMFAMNPLRMFHFIAIIILIFIVVHYIINYLNKRSRNIVYAIVIGAFLCLTAGHFLFLILMFQNIGYMIYIIAHSFQLVGYLALLYTSMKVLIR